MLDVFDKNSSCEAAVLGLRCKLTLVSAQGICMQVVVADLPTWCLSS